MTKDNQKTISFKFSGFSGDVIWYLSGIKHICEKMNAKAKLYLWLDRPGSSYEGAEHPYEGKMINRYAFDMLHPLISWQPYIDSCEPFAGQDVHIDMDLIRQTQVSMPYGNLAHWLGIRFADMQPDLSKKWLTLRNPINPEFRDMIVINRTSRYHNHFISYFFLKEYREHLLFVGTEKEHEDFQKEWQFTLPHFKVKDFMDLAMVIADCKFFLGNQSMCFAIAEGLKKRRILEMCPAAPNVHPVGEHARYFMFQEALVAIFEELNKPI